MCRRGDDSFPRGFCGAPASPNTARVALHMWEEPFISGERGSGTIFFTGCTLRCVYCQNCDISVSGTVGSPRDAESLVRAMLELQDMRCRCNEVDVVCADILQFEHCADQRFGVAR